MNQKNYAVYFLCLSVTFPTPTRPNLTTSKQTTKAPEKTTTAGRVTTQAPTYLPPDTTKAQCTAGSSNPQCAAKPTTRAPPTTVK